MTENLHMKRYIPRIQVLVAQETMKDADRLLAIFKDDPDIHLMGIVADGRELVSWMINRQIDIIVTDMSLPIMDGLFTMQLISNLNKKSKFIFFTDYDDEWLIRKAINMGASGFVSRNSEDSCIKDAIKVIYKGGAYIDTDSLKKLSKCNLKAVDMSKFSEYLI
jgi:DNA-binding NarL/FixJ family response regulator